MDLGSRATVFERADVVELVKGVLLEAVEEVVGNNETFVGGW